MLPNDELRRRQAGSQDSLDADLVPRDCQAAECALQQIEGQAGINERPDEHVAGNSGKAIEV